MALNTPWHIFFKCFQNQATSEETGELNDWLEEDIENIKLMDEIYHIYSISEPVPHLIHPDTNEAWGKVKQKISLPSVPGKSLFFKFNYAMAVLAVVIFGLMSYWLLSNYRHNQFSRQYTEIITPMGQKTMILLPDSSRVWLNSGSTLKYNRNFNGKERDVTLMGEAFFKVKKDKSRRFRVTTGSLYVDVHGTCFNIKNYSDDNKQEITVVEGIVGISNSRSKKEIRRLTKGQQASLNKKSGEITFCKGDTDLVTSWKDNELIFNNTPLPEVVKYLERWYGVNIRIESALKSEHKYTFKIKTESLREMLDMMKIMTPMNYRISGKDVFINYINQ